jgi:hypothetical protein
MYPKGMQQLLTEDLKFWNISSLKVCQSMIWWHVPIIHPPSHQGGDVNIRDSDGDTPLYSVESMDTAQYLINHGALIDIKNYENLSVRILNM